MTLAGQYLGHYHVIRQIGRGGMGEVYLAEDSHVTRQVAIKVVRSEQIAYPDYNTAQETTRLFQREMKSISQLDHSHILNIYDFGEEKVTGGSIIYMVMPYRSEGSLTDWLAQRDNTISLYQRMLGTCSLRLPPHCNMSTIETSSTRMLQIFNFLVRANTDHPTYPDLFLVDFGVAKFRQRPPLPATVYGALSLIWHQSNGMVQRFPPQISMLSQLWSTSCSRVLSLFKVEQNRSCSST